ncbi:MAG: hypothetical protein K2M47_00405 [Clostridiales bacterium]|nr:hypothetical protein [Clostridiales bacterium]
MKSKKHLIALFAVIAALFASVIGLTACGDTNDNGNGKNAGYVVSVDASKSVVLEIGETVDFRQYFTVTDKNGNQIVVTDEMLDLSKVDTSKEGQFTVTLAIGSASKTITFTVKKDGGTGSDDLAAILAKYTDGSKWNFATTLTIGYSGDDYEEYYEYKGYNIKYEYSEYGNYTDYIEYVVSTDTYYYYADDGSGAYTKYAEDTNEYESLFGYCATIDLSELGDFEFTYQNGVYSAKLPNDVGNNVIGEYDDATWTTFALTVNNGNIATLTAQSSDGWTYEYVFSKFGTVSFTLPNAQSSDDNDDDDYDDITVDELLTILIKYGEDDWVQNFAAHVTVSSSSSSYEEYYDFLGENIRLASEDASGNEFTDYVEYDAQSNTYFYYYDNLDGTYTKLSETDEDFEDLYFSMNFVDLSKLWEYEFTAESGIFTATQSNNVGNAVLGEFEDSTWTAFTLTAKNGNVSKIVATTSDGYTFTYVLSKFGSVSIQFPSTSGGTPTTPTGVMEQQTYDANSFDDERLQDKMPKTGDDPDPAIGLPSTGTYNALVIPIAFANKTIDDDDLENLNIAFNGDRNSTGWESVNSYYYKSSYGKLNISFDIAGYTDMVDEIGNDVGYYTSSKNYSYYAELTATEDGYTYNNGDNVLLHEVLAYYESKLDLTQYDYNNDGTIDAVYLIYSAPVDYSDDSFYWAYVTWDDYEKTYDGLHAYYYLFAGLNFMIESVHGGYTNEYYPEIAGLKVNAATYIHETGHLLGLDDYYDTDERSGSNEGLGGADMMDYNVGDQNVYSKIMLGWLTPEIVVSTQTITIKSSQERGDAILIPLNFDNSYFCEYLLIDLYSANGLNQLHSSVDDSILYGGATYGVRIYHVTSWINNPFSDEYGSFTDCNNSVSSNALIKLVEADGHTKFSDSNGYAIDSDLWQAGDKLSEVFPQYMTNDGKTLIFDITVVSVSETEATITITYAA